MKSRSPTFVSTAISDNIVVVDVVVTVVVDVLVVVEVVVEVVVDVVAVFRDAFQFH